MIVGFPSAFWVGSLGDRGAVEPTFGTGDSCSAGGLIHELSSWRTVMIVRFRGFGFSAAS